MTDPRESSKHAKNWTEVQCPVCHKLPGERCADLETPHYERVKAARAASRSGVERERNEGNQSDDPAVLVEGSKH